MTLAVSLAMLLLAAVPALAQTPVTLDFEAFPGPDGRLGTADDVATPSCSPVCAQVGSSYAGMGIVFASGTLFQSSIFPGKPATNHFVSSTRADVSLAFPVYGVTITSYSVWTAVLYAFDAGGNLIATSTLVNPNPGGTFLLGALSVSTAVPIQRFVVLEAGCTVGGAPCNNILNLDDLVLATAPAPAAVPVPASSPVALALLGLLVLALGVAARRSAR